MGKGERERAWSSCASVGAASLSRSFYLPPHTHTDIQKHKVFLAREREHMSYASPFMLFTLYSFFRGETAAAAEAAIRSSARHSVVVKARRGAQWSS